MSKKSDRLQTTRLFSLQLANHDGLFAPRQKNRRPLQRLKTCLFFLPVVLAIAFPSFKLGRAVLKNPGLELPDSLKLGELFTLPANEEENLIPVIAGRALGLVDGKEPLYVGAAFKPFDFEIHFDFINRDEHARLKGLVPRTEHPTYPLFVKKVHVLVEEPPPAPVEKPAPREKTARHELEKSSAPPQIGSAEAKVYDRYDGNMRLRCWRAPKIDPLGVDPLKPRRSPRLGGLSAAGPGEVVYSSPLGSTEMTVVLYHGGGLYSRYWGLKELRLPKNGRLNTGQTIGYVHLAPHNKTTPVNWQALMGGVGGPGEIKIQAILDLSSRLCDSK